MILTVEHNEKQEAIEVYCDNEGLDLLIRNLNNLKKNKGHLHFMTPSWAGNELTEEKQNRENTLINHLKINLKPD